MMPRRPLVCGRCRECCKGFRVLDIEDADMYEVFWKEGVSYLAQKENGDCIYLRDEGCSIYETRPQECRDFDCRDYKDDRRMLPRIRLAGMTH